MAIRATSLAGLRRPSRALARGCTGALHRNPRGRQGASMRLIAAAVVALLAMGVAGTATAGANPRIAYGYFTEKHGRWAYSRSSLTPEVVTHRLIRSGAEY